MRSLFGQIILFATVVLNCASLSLTKPLSLETLLLRNRTLQQQLRHEIWPEDLTVQPEENTNQASDVIRELDDIHVLESVLSAHNRTARDAGQHHCVMKIDWVWDSCRGKFVNKYHCLGQHLVCFGSILKHGKPKCQTVYGYPSATFVGKCPMLPMGCQCAP